MKIERVKGKLREVRRMLPEESRRLLVGELAGDAADAKQCLLKRTLHDIGGYTGNDVKQPR